MKVDSVITLSNNVSCILLDKAVYNNENYFLATVLDKNDEPGDFSCILKEVIENGETYVEREGDEKVLTEVAKLFTKSIVKTVGEMNEDVIDE